LEIATSEVPSFCKLIKSLPGIFYNIDLLAPGNLQLYGDQSTEITGYTPEELQKKNGKFFFDRLIHPDDIAFVHRKKRDLVKSQSLCTLEFRILTKHGEIKYVRDEFVFRNQKGNKIIIEGSITEMASFNLKGRIFHQLKAYRDAVDVNMISSITDRSGKIVYANKNFCAISKFSIQELIGQNHRIVCSRHHPPEFFEELWQTISSGKLWHGEILNRAKDGTTYWVDTVIIPVFDEERAIVNYLSLRMLIDNRKQVETERKLHTELLEKIAFIVAHKIRGPLCSILGLINILVNHTINPADSKNALRYLHNAANELNDLTRELSNMIFENEIELKTKDFKEKLLNDKRLNT
jgi:PAS domain S-box-containing protein